MASPISNGVSGVRITRSTTYESTVLLPQQCGDVFGFMIGNQRAYRQDRTGEGIHLGQAIHEYFLARGYDPYWIRFVGLPVDIEAASVEDRQVAFDLFSRFEQEANLIYYRSERIGGNGYEVKADQWRDLLSEIGERELLRPLAALAPLLRELSNGIIPAKKLWRSGQAAPIEPSFWNSDDQTLYSAMRPYLQWPLDALDPEIFIVRASYEEFLKREAESALERGYRIEDQYTVDRIAAYAPKLYHGSLEKFRKAFMKIHPVKSRDFAKLMSSQDLNHLRKSSGGQRGAKRASKTLRVTKPDR